MQKVTVQANTKKKMTPLRSDASAAYQHYERKTSRSGFQHRQKLHKSKTDSVQICEKGTSKGSVPYKTGIDINAQRRHDRQGLCEGFVTDAGIDEMQLSGIAVDKKHQQRRRSRLTDQGSRH